MRVCVRVSVRVQCLSEPVVAGCACARARSCEILSFVILAHSFSPVNAENVLPETKVDGSSQSEKKCLPIYYSHVLVSSCNM
jgi:hypothetical protein